MDRNSPAQYIEPSAQQSIVDTKTLIEYIYSLPTNGLVRPILTPRFAITCTPELLNSLGSMLKSDPALHIQTHISENPSEVAFTKSLFPECSSYADVYDRSGLLGPRTILAHGCHLEEEELEVRSNAITIAHNAFLTLPTSSS
jgi:guanine deaminase